MEFLFAGIFIVFPLLITLIMKLIGLSLFRVSLPSFVIVSLFAFAYLGIFPLFFFLDEYRFLVGVQDRQIVLLVFYYSLITISLVVLGFYITKLIVRQTHFRFSMTPTQRSLLIESFSLFILLTLSAAVTFNYVSHVPRLAIMEVFSDGSVGVEKARSAMGNAFSGKYHWYYLFMNEIASFILFCSYALLLRGNNTAPRAIKICLFACALVLAVFNSVMAGEKAPVVWLLIGMYFTYSLARHSGTISVGRLTLVIAVCGCILLAAYMYFMSTTGLVNTLGLLISRAFAGSIEPAYYYLEYFPSHQNFLLGRSFPNFGGIFNYQYFNIPTEIMNWRNPELLENGVVGSMPTVFWGEMYANFGLAGIAIAPVFVGIFIYLIHFTLLRLRPTPLKIGLTVWLILHYKNLATGGLFGYIADIYVFFIVGIFIFIRFVQAFVEDVETHKMQRI